MSPIVPQSVQPFQLDEYYMQRCLALAARGITTPNPKVGCVVLDKHGRKVGEGFHHKAGEPHAEVMALRQAGELAKEGTLYVNLEPCNHTGRTPPCTKAIKQAGIATVICGMLDPNPKVAGKGRNALQNARITVRHGILEAECQALNAPFVHFMTTGTPYVTLKVATSLDGKLGPRGGKRQWLTGEISRQFVHQLRQQHDAVLTTAETVLADNAKLTVRDVPGGPQRQPIRVVLDRQNRLAAHPELALWQDEAPVWRIVSNTYEIAELPEHPDEPDGGSSEDTLLNSRSQDRVFTVTDTGVGLDLAEVMTLLGKQEITTVMVEAGGRLAGTILKDSLAHRVVQLVAPVVIGDEAAPALSGIPLGQDGCFQGFAIQQRHVLDKDTVWVMTPAEHSS